MSGSPYGKYSGMVLASLAPAANGTTKVFSKVTAANQVGDQATEGDIFRCISNDSATVTMSIGETVAQANAGTFKLPPGKDFVLLGPSGAGWKGDLYAKGDGAATLSVMSW